MNSRVIVCGSRHFTDIEAVNTALDSFYLAWRSAQTGEDERFTLVHGACRGGADAIADRWAQEKGRSVTVERHPAEWQRYGRIAGPTRNKRMAHLGADVVLAFVKDNSPGTAGMIREANNAGIRVVEFHEKTEEA